MFFGPDLFQFMHLLEFFETERKNSPKAIRLPLGWVLSRPLHSTSGVFSRSFKAVTQRETDSKLAEQIRCWYDFESYQAFKQVDSRTAADAQAHKILQETTYYIRSQSYVGVFWTDDQNVSPNNYFSALVQFKSLERRLGKVPNLKEQFLTNIRCYHSKSYFIEVEKSTCFKIDQPRELFLPRHPVFQSLQTRQSTTIPQRCS